MRFLLDTHVIMWAIIGSEKIDKELKAKLIDKNNQVFYSTVSPWEVEIKHQKYKNFSLSGEQLCFLCDQNHIFNLQIKNEHINKLKEFSEISEKYKHNDPFDKMLLAQALTEDMIFVTHDKKFKAYDYQNILLV